MLDHIPGYVVCLKLTCPKNLFQFEGCRLGGGFLASENRLLFINLSPKNANVTCCK